jgi:hypothetical protein
MVHTIVEFAKSTVQINGRTFGPMDVDDILTNVGRLEITTLARSSYVECILFQVHQGRP